MEGYLKYFRVALQLANLIYLIIKWRRKPSLRTPLPLKGGGDEKP